MAQLEASAEKMNAKPQDRRRRKRWLVILAVALAMLALYVALVYPVAHGVNKAKVKQREQQLCLQQMERLYSAAVSLCLEQKLKPDELLNIQQLASYVRPDDLTCPSGHAAYPGFSVLEGPTCPNGHKFAPGENRPLRTPSSNRKVAGLYLANGLTNLIDNTEGQQP